MKWPRVGHLFNQYVFHGHGHKFCCVHLVTLFLPCPVSPGVGRFTTICSGNYALYNEMYDLNEGIEITDEEVNDKEFISLGVEKDSSDKSLSGF